MNFTNYTNLVTGRDNASFYNPSCIDELQKMATKCTDFKAQVINTVHQRFLIGMIVTFILFAFIIYVKYDKPKFSQTEFYKKHIEYRIDFFTLMIFIITISLLFI